MPNRVSDITGKKYGKLIVVSECGRDKWGRVLWLCKCECGKETITTKNKLEIGKKKSCGCLIDDIKTWIHRKHGMSETRLYGIYQSMKTRCYRNHVAHHLYKDRGITICEEWSGEDGFSSFAEWAMKNGYEDDLTIDRKDNEKGYSPDNCRWITMKEQQNNKRNNVCLTFNGETHTIAEWGEITGFGGNCIRARLRNGWSVERTLTETKQRRY